MHKFKNLPVILLAFIAGSLVSIATTVALAHGGDVSKIHGCVKNSILNAANIRIVSATTNCAANETALDWNIQGVPGPTGVPGQAASGSAYFGLPFICSQVNLSSLSDKFKNKDFSNAQIRTACAFNDVDISGVIFKNGNLSGANFNGSNLSNADLSNVTFDTNSYGAQFQNTNLQNANFQNDAINRVTFTGAQNMDTANLTGVTWSNVTCPDGTNSDDNGNTCAGHLTP